MPSIAPIIPSGSTNGRPIKVAATTTPGTLIHTATATAGAMDSVTITAINTDTVTRILTVELGGTTNPDDRVTQQVPPGAGLFLVVGAHRLAGGVAVRAYADATNVVNVVATVERYTP